MKEMHIIRNLDKVTFQIQDLVELEGGENEVI